MAVHFHPLKVKKIVKETPDCVSVSFWVPDELKTIFRYEHGQNIAIRKIFDAAEIRRNYSICAAPHENELKVAIKKVEGGLFSGFANENLKAGDELEVLPPTGKFNTPLHKAQKKSYLAFAAGSGITPVISIIKSTLQTEPKSDFTLVYGNKSLASVIFFEELEGLKNKYLDRFQLINILSREQTETALNFGRINKEKLESLQKLIDYNRMDEFFICGPEQMIFTVKDFLLENKIDPKKIHYELFTTPGEKIIKPTAKAAAKPTGPQSHITVKLDGRSFSFYLSADGESILDAALKQGADLPYACKGGVCCTCKAKLMQGRVKMDENWGLEDEEVEQGYILTCQSHPVSGDIVVDFDIK